MSKEKEEDVVEAATVTVPESLRDNLVEATLSLHEKLQRRVPRLYNLVLQLLVPLTIMVSMAFLFGGLLARAEKGLEIEQNDQALRDVALNFLQHVEEQTEIHAKVLNLTQQCASDLETTPEYMESLLNCQREILPSIFRNNFTREEIQKYMVLAGLNAGTSFNWIRCDFYEGDLGPLDVVSGSNFVLQFLHYLGDFIEDLYAWDHYFKEHDPDRANRTIAKEYQFWHHALERASGAKSCVTHVPGGAFFWVTVMTTIGYGTAAPSSFAGRLLVYTCGALTIVLFIGLNAIASNVVRVITEDGLIRCGLRRLTRGLPAMLLWMLLTILWIFILAGVAHAWSIGRMGEWIDFDFSNNLWYSFITITTVGLGDFAIPHEEYEARDMFSIPLIMLLGFVILGTFAEKLIVLLVPLWPREFDELEKLLQATQPPDPDGGEVEDWRTSNGATSIPQRRHSI